MSNPTTPFSWQMPTATDLVTDLPADFEVFGQAVATSMADLLGGTSGQVLAKNSNTDMDFVWVAQDDSNAIQNTIVDAKGDLIAASASDVPARLAVGSNGETLVADSAATTGLRYQSAYNGNAIINGGMDIWQRGTTFTTTSGVAYTADRWASHTISAGGSVTTSRQTVSDTTNLPTIQYATKFQRVAANTNTGILSFFNTLESADSYRFAGQTATLSFYAKKGANYSAASSILVSNVASGTGTDEPLRSFTGLIDRTQNNTLTTTWQRFTQTVSITATATEVGVQFYFTPVGTAGADDSISITGVQLELGSVATTFKRSNGSGATIQGELAACQRYYYRFVPFAGSGGNYYGPYAVGGATSTTNAYVTGHLPVALRTAPTFNRSGSQIYNSASNIAVTALSNAWATGTSFSINVTVASGLTAGQVCHFAANNNSADYFDLSAEL